MNDSHDGKDAHSSGLLDQPEFSDPHRPKPWRGFWFWFLAIDVIIALVVVALFLTGILGSNSTPNDPTGNGGANGADPVVIYCTHDAVYSQEVIDAFTKKTGIAVRVVHDSEATKSLGLIERLKRETNNPKAHVFWNNELLGMVDLANANVLESYKGSGWSRMPESVRDDAGLWTGMGARMRVIILNTDAVEQRGDAAMRWASTQLDENDLSRFAIAKPMYGTTLTHYTVLWDAKGAAGLKALHADRIERGMKIVDGNGATKNLTASGVLDFAWTDTDDYFQAVDAGKPVAAVPAQVDGKTIVIPNTIAMVKGAFTSDTQRANAEKLIDYLLSAEVEEHLAGTARQFPLGPVDESKLPDEVIELRQHMTDAYPLGGLSEERGEVLNWLKSEFLE